MAHARPGTVTASARDADVVLRARLDARSLPRARTALHRAVDDARGDEVVVDVSDVEIWNAAALGVLVGAQQRAARRGLRVVLVGPSARMRRMLGAARLDRLLVLRDAT